MSYDLAQAHFYNILTYKRTVPIPSFHTDEEKDDMILKGFNTMICMLRGCGGVVLSTLILGCCCCHG